MNHDEMMTMCEKLSYKYKAPQMREDLMQEGILACLEILAVEDEPHPAKLYRAADKAMWDHLNFSVLPVHVPATRASRTALRGTELDPSQTYSENGEETLREAVSSVGIEYDDTSMSVHDYADTYEKLEYESYVAAKLVTTLSGEDLDIIKKRYYEGLTQDQVADIMGVNRATISRKEKQALKQLGKHL
jgi:RNA polymerase sigma factor (sigma-70 family)